MTQKYTNTQIKDSIQRVSRFIATEKRNPQTIRVSQNTLKLQEYQKLPQITDAKNRINKWIQTHNNKLPNYVDICGFQLQKNEYKTRTGKKIHKRNWKNCRRKWNTYARRTHF